MSVVFSEHLPLLITAPDGIQKLRGLILELAVRGRLVQQNPEDEPASELLKRAAQERVRLEDIGVCRKYRPVPTHNVEVESSKLPVGWALTSLANVALINPRNTADDSVDVSFVPMAMIGNRFEGSHQQDFRKWGKVKQGFTHFAEGDVGVAKITPCFENSKACVFANLKNGIGAGTTELHIVRPLAQTLAPRYVLAYLKAPMFLAVGETKMTGTAGQKRLPKDFLESNPFPLPPLAEQHRIVAKVDELMALCDRLEAEQADAESAQAKLVETLLGTLTESTDVADFAANWQRLTRHFDEILSTPYAVDRLRKAVLSLAAEGRLVPQLAQAERYPLSALIEGDSLNGCSKKPGNNSSGVQILRISAGTGNDDFLVDETDHKWIDATPAEIEKFRLLPDDLLACRFNGNLHYVGSFSLYQGKSSAPQVFPDKLIRFRARRDKVLPNYLRYVLNAGSAREQIESFCATTVGNIGISATNLKTVKVRVPPLDEQHRIIARVDKLMTLCSDLKAKLSESHNRQAQLASTLVESALKAA